MRGVLDMMKTLIVTNNKALIWGVFVILSVSIGACKETTKYWQIYTTKFNVFYHARVSFDKALDKIKQKSEPDLFSDEVVPIEPLESGKESAKEELERTETKLTITIQDRSFVDAGKERNPYIAQAYLMLGKVQYLQEKYFDALETLNYAQTTYPLHDDALEIQYWIIRTKIRLNNFSGIEDELNLMFKNRAVDGELRQALARTYAYYLIENQRYEEAANFLRIAMGSSRDDDDKALLNYALAQIYQRLSQYEQSNSNFEEVVDIYPSNYQIYLFAKISIIDNAYSQNQDYEEAIDAMSDLLTDDKNSEYAYLIHYKLGKYAADRNIGEDIERYLKQTLAQKQNINPVIQTSAYEDLGDYYVENSRYPEAYLHYDSALTAGSQIEGRDLYELKKKKKNLEVVDRYIVQNHHLDSLIHLAKMTPNQLEEHFQSIIDSIEDASRNNLQLHLSIDESQWEAVGDARTKFYFYNKDAVKQGVKRFYEEWGEVDDVDNWAISLLATTVDEPTNSAISLDVDELVAEALPLREQLDSLTRRRLVGEYSLGLIYKTNFKQYDLSYQIFIRLLTQEPDDNMKEGIYYNLYYVSKQQNNTVLTKKYKEQMLNLFPNSPFTTLVLDEGDSFDVSLLNAPTEPTNVYKQAFTNFKTYNYLQAKELLEEGIKRYPNDKMLPKFHFLSAMVMYHLQRPEEAYEKMVYIIKTFPYTREQKRAQLMIERIDALDQQHLIYQSATQDTTGYKVLIRPLLYADKLATYLERESIYEPSFRAERIYFTKDEDLFLFNLRFENSALASRFEQNIQQRISSIGAGIQVFSISDRNLDILLDSKRIYSYYRFVANQNLTSGVLEGNSTNQ